MIWKEYSEKIIFHEVIGAINIAPVAPVVTALSLPKLANVNEGFYLVNANFTLSIYSTKCVVARTL
jgi:hypothetical protein